MIKIYRNIKKKWVVESDLGNFVFDTATEAHKKMNEINVIKLNGMVGNCEDCGRELLECECIKDNE